MEIRKKRWFIPLELHNLHNSQSRNFQQIIYLYVFTFQLSLSLSLWQRNHQKLDVGKTRQRIAWSILLMPQSKSIELSTYRAKAKKKEENKNYWLTVAKAK
jgi:hypothetical protein